MEKAMVRVGSREYAVLHENGRVERLVYRNPMSGWHVLSATGRLGKQVLAEFERSRAALARGAGPQT